LQFKGIRLFNPVLAEPILPGSALAGSPGYNGISSAVIFAPEESLPKQLESLVHLSLRQQLRRFMQKTAMPEVIPLAKAVCTP
jgi:hypothetical protein